LLHDLCWAERQKGAPKAQPFSAKVEDKPADYPGFDPAEWEAFVQAFPKRS
jgi:hypothetical protein